MAKHINWTPGMDERLIVLNRERVFFRLIAEALVVPLASVHRRVKVLDARGLISANEVSRYFPRTKQTVFKSRGPTKWTPDRLARVSELYRNGHSNEQIATLLGETCSAIRGQVRLLRKRGELPSGPRPSRHSARPNRRIFTTQMDETLIQLHPSKSRNEIAQALGVTPRQVTTRASQLRKLGHLEPSKIGVAQRRETIIRLYRDGQSIVQIAKAIGSTPGAIGVSLVRYRKQGCVGTRPRPYTANRSHKVDMETVVEMTLNHVSTAQIAQYFGASEHTILKHVQRLRRDGTLPRPTRVWTKERTRRLVTLYGRRTKIRVIARLLNVSERAVAHKLTRLRKKNQLPSRNVRP